MARRTTGESGLCEDLNATDTASSGCSGASGPRRCTMCRVSQTVRQYTHWRCTGELYTSSSVNSTRPCTMMQCSQVLLLHAASLPSPSPLNGGDSLHDDTFLNQFRGTRVCRVGRPRTRLCHVVSLLPSAALGGPPRSESNGVQCTPELY